jgi:site-specific DNA recombinase
MRKVSPKTTKAQQNTLGLKEDCTALYIRVSTEKQADEGFSLDAQRERLAAYCQAQGWAVCPGHIYADEGISGTHTERPQYQAMLQAAKAGSIQRIVAMKLDRLSRNVRDFLGLVDELQAGGCDLVLIKESFDTSTPHGRFALTMFAAMAELEASTITERVMSGKAQKASSGGYNGSACPLGYEYATGVFSVNPGQSGTVVEVFSRWLAGDSMCSIARQLTDSGIATKRGGAWAQPTVRAILLNGFYAGLAQWDGVEVAGGHPAIIDVETYHAAVARVESAKRGNPNFGRG